MSQSLGIPIWSRALQNKFKHGIMEYSESSENQIAFGKDNHFLGGGGEEIIKIKKETKTPSIIHHKSSLRVISNAKLH